MNLRQTFYTNRRKIEKRTGIPLHKTQTGSFPENADQLKKSELFNQWWYYTIELMPGLITKGIYPKDLPMIPRLMLRKCSLQGASCLDLGSMEGLIPVLMSKGGASSVLATDAVDHCVQKMDGVKHYYNANFEYESVGLMYDLYKKLPNRSFDLINCSGLLYHVFSPLAVLSGVRPLLKRNGFFIVSTNVILEKGFFMEFDNAGRIQEEANTFWYISVELLDYMLRYLKLAPIDCIYIKHSEVNSGRRVIFDRPSGYMSVLCQANDDMLASKDDQWMAKSAKISWEYRDLSNWELANSQPKSHIRCKGEINKQHFRDDLPSLDLWKAMSESKPAIAEHENDTHTLRLSDET